MSASFDCSGGRKLAQLDLPDGRPAWAFSGSAWHILAKGANISEDKAYGNAFYNECK